MTRGPSRTEPRRPLALGAVAAAVAALVAPSAALPAEAAATAAAPAPAPAPATATALDFAGTRYVHRWSKDGQNEYTPAPDANLAAWHDMLTLDLYERTNDGEALAAAANAVHARYAKAGRIVRTNSKPAAPGHPAEHLVVAMFGGDGSAEVAFARMLLTPEGGLAVVWSHRAYGPKAAQDLGAWVADNGPRIEQLLMAWDGVPPRAALKALPQSAR